LENRFRGGLRSLGSDFQHSRAVNVGEDGYGVVPFPKALFVDADVRNGIRFTSLETPLHGPVHDRLSRVPGESEEGGGSFDRAARLQDFDSEGFKEESKTAVRPGPRRHDRLEPVARAAAARQPGDQLSRKLHRVEVPPAAFFRVIRKAARLATFRAGNARTNVRQADFDSPLIEPKVNSIDSPGVVEAQKPGIVHRECAHPVNLRHRGPQNELPAPRNSPKNRLRLRFGDGQLLRQNLSKKPTPR